MSDANGVEWPPEDERSMMDMASNGQNSFINRLARAFLGQRGQIEEREQRTRETFANLATIIGNAKHAIDVYPPNTMMAHQHLRLALAALASQPPSQQSLPHVSPTTEPE